MPNSDLHLPQGALRVPESQSLGTVKAWWEYGVWGLLFHDDQSPWLTLVECLQICFYRARHKLPLLEGQTGGFGSKHETIHYGNPLNHNLRHLLFRDRDIRSVAERGIDDSAMWKAWGEQLTRDQVPFDYSYLRERFESFRDMANAVELLRSAEIESYTAKRWTSRHVLPLGEPMLFPDVNSKNGLDRKFMRRTGELLYLMLNRSERYAEVAELIGARLLNAPTPWNDLADKLAGRERGQDVTTTSGYLPLPQHRTYNVLAEDWIALLRLEGVPVENILDPLQRLSALAQALYIVRRAQEATGPAAHLPPFFLDLVGAAGGNAVRKLSINQHLRHKAMLQEAMSRFVGDYAASKEWKAAVAEDARERARDLLRRRFLWNPSRPQNPDRLPSPPEQLEELRKEAQANRGHSITSAFKSHVRHMGLLRAFRRAGSWYAPSDSFLEALVLATVRTPMEFGQFLQQLYTRYNLVIGPEEVRTAFKVATGALPAPLADLQENERRLEERLRVLGFLDRKSDDCAFVMNPFNIATPAQAGAADRVPA